MSTPKDKARWNAYDASHRKERRAKDRLRYALNRDRLRAKNRAYHAAHKEEILTRSRSRYAAKRESDNARKAAYRASHPDVIRAQTRSQYYSVPPEKRQARTKFFNAKYAEQRRAWRERHKERLAKRAAKWTKENSARKRAATARRLAAKIKATPSWAVQAAIQEFYDEAARLTRETGIKHEVDHIVPLRSPLVCGLHVACNLQVLTRDENRKKHNRLIAA